MFGSFDHVGYVVRDLDAAVAQAEGVLGLPLARTIELPQFAIVGAFLGAGSGTLEIFTFTDEQLLAPRLEGEEQRMDHIAFRVQGLDALTESLRAAGGRFSGPDRRGEVAGPFDLASGRHLWTLPESTAGVALQLIEPLAP